MQLGELAEGTEFMTRLTKRSGVVVERPASVRESVQVEFEDGVVRLLAPKIEVDVVEGAKGKR